MTLDTHHAATTTPDIDRLCQFYIDGSGFEEPPLGGWEVGITTNDAIVVLKDPPPAKIACLCFGKILMEIFQYDALPDRPMPHSSGERCGLHPLLYFFFLFGKRPGFLRLCIRIWLLARVNRPKLSGSPLVRITSVNGDRSLGALTHIHNIGKATGYVYEFTSLTK